MSSVFDNLIDQEAVIKTLKEAIAASNDPTNNSQNMTHSWLFTGPAGSGRSNAAIAFAAGLLCEEGGCANCINCTTTIDGSHADIELVRTEGLSIKVEEVRELITRTSWSPSVGNYRVVVIEDADRLTESAANALLKVIEEPGARTVWLLCAPTLTDVIPTIRSRCRHLTLRTPSIKAVTRLLIERDGIDPKMAEFAANAAQGHIGRAKYLATNEEARKTRDKILSIPFNVNDLASAFEAANALVELAKSQALAEAEVRDEAELAKLKESYGTTGSKLATGGSKALKELEKNQSSRIKNEIKSIIHFALHEIMFNQNNLLKSQLETVGMLSGQKECSENHNRALATNDFNISIVSASKTINSNVSIQILTESIFCNLIT
jgi:DNA polymerase-3 subunit delta'